MDKLIELLNEFRPTISCANFKEHYEFIDDDIYLIRKWIDWVEEEFPMYVCYKKGEFIKRLIDNYKIDLTKLEDNSDWYWIELWDDAYEVLALLSIQDNPIEFLVSILK